MLTSVCVHVAGTSTGVTMVSLDLSRFTPVRTPVLEAAVAAGLQGVEGLLRDAADVLPAPRPSTRNQAHMVRVMI